MAITVKTIRTRLKSIGSIKKITKTMEMVAAAKMRRAIREVLLSKHYAKEAWHVVGDIASRTDPSYHPLLKPRAGVKKAVVVLFSSNRGLCGGFNSQMVSRALEFVLHDKENIGTDYEIEWIVVGKKGATLLARKGAKVVAVYEKPELANKVSDIMPIAKTVLEAYQHEEYDRVILAYTDFTSPLKQKPVERILLPYQTLQTAEADEKSAVISDSTEHLFEPGPREILNYFLPHLTVMQIYQALLESNASEHSARMAAMRNASDATADIIDGLTLMYNQVRQAGITREIAEIAGAKAAMG